MVTLFTDAMLEDQRGPPTWRLHTRLCNFVRNISTNTQLWDDAHTLDLENCHLYLLSTISQFFDFVRCIVFDSYFIACQRTHSIEERKQLETTQVTPSYKATVVLG